MPNTIFKQNFSLPQDGFGEPFDLSDAEVGFSVYKERERGYRSLFKIYIQNEDYENENNIKPVNVSVEYGKSTEDGIILSSSDFKRRLSFPIGLESKDEFFYDLGKNKILYKDKELKGIELLHIIDDLHLKPTRFLKGFWLRTKLWFFHIFLSFLLKILFRILSGFQYLVSGEKIKIFRPINTKEDRYSVRTTTKAKLDVKKSDSIDFFGYKVRPWIAGIYSAGHLLIFLFFYHQNFKPQWLMTIFSNDFLTFLYGILSLGLANTLLPILFSAFDFKSPLQFLQKLYFSSVYKKVRI